MTSLNITFDRVNSSGVVAAKLWIGTGSSVDPIGKKGIHHLAASLMTRGCGPYDNTEIANIIEGCGAGLRCDSYEDGILISLKSTINDLTNLIPIIGWMVLNPHNDRDQFKLEKDLILQSLKRHKENPFQLAFEGWSQLAYPDGPYGHDPMGTIKDIQNINRQDLLPISENIKHHEINLVISGCLTDVVEKRIYEIESIKTLEKNCMNKSIKENLMIKEIKNNLRYTITEQEIEQVIIMIGKPTIPYCHNDDLAMRLVSSHLGSGMSSILFKELRENNGLAYDVGIHYPVRACPAPFLIHASTTKEKAEMSLEILNNCWSNVIENELKEEELNLAKAKLKGLIAQNHQSFSIKIHLVVIK